VKSWVHEIEKVTKLSRDSSTGSALQEVNFWLGMDRALQNIDDQLKSDGIGQSFFLLSSSFF